MATELATAYVSLIPSFRGGTAVLQREAGQMGQAASKSMADEVTKAGGKSGVLGKAFIGVAAVAGGVFAGAKLLGGFLSEAQEAQTVAKQTAAVLKSTGGAAQVSAKGVDMLATALSKKSGVDDEVIASGENVLLTFTKVRNETGKGNDIFNQGTSIALDMSKALGTDLQGSVLQVGKALNDPIKGVTALQRVGVSFTADQKKQIETLVKSGDVLGAQKIILGELNTEFGGAAAASATAGDKLKVAWGNVQEQLGLLLLPVLEKVAGFLSDALPKAADFAESAVHKIGGFISGVWAKIGPTIIGALSSAWDWIKETWPKVRDTVIHILANIVTWIRLNWDNVRDILVGVFDGFKGAVTWIIDHQPILIGILAAIGVGLVSLASYYVAMGIAAAASWIAAAAPVVAIGAAIAAVVAGFVWLYQNVDWFHKAVDAVKDAIVAAAQWIGDNWRGIWDTIVQIVQDVVGVVAGIISTGVEVWNTAWQVVSEIYDFLRTYVIDPIIAYYTFLFDTAVAIIKGGITTIKTAWSVLTDIYDFLKTWVIDPIIAYYTFLFDVVEGIVKVGVTTITTAWNAIQAVFDFFRDHIYNPVIALATDLKDTVVQIFTDIVSGVQTAWGALYAIYTFLDVQVIRPIESAISDVKSFITDTFTTIVSAVEVAWDRLSDVVKVPINLVIDFYNDGIRGVWNNVISKIPGIGDLPSVAKLNSGGKVPGAGSTDTVPAMLTPGEFVVQKKYAEQPGIFKALQALNGGGSVDPAIFGYAAGGPVKSVEETQAWMRAQAGKKYVFPLTGPNAYDCSGFTSALINFVLGAINPYFRRHSSGSVGSDPALKAGDGDPATGLLIGAKPPYTTNRSGDLVGHTAATVAGLNAEATPPVVLVGGGARGAFALPQHYYMPGFGGPSVEDQGIIDQLKSLLTLHLPDLGGPPIGDLLTKMFSDFPQMVFDFLAKKMPSVIYNAVKDAIVGFFTRDAHLVGAAAAFADGGTTRTGPIIVGERGPEIMWANGGEYIQANGDAFGRGPLLQVGAIFGDGEFKRMVREEIANMDFERRAAPVPAGRR